MARTKSASTERTKKRKKSPTVTAWLGFLKELTPLLVALGLLWFVRQEFWVTGLVALVILASFWIKYEKGEWTLFLVGAFLGFGLEFVGDAVYQLQSWQTLTPLTFPLWLPLFWGYAFVFIRRAGNLIVKKE